MYCLHTKLGSFLHKLGYILPNLTTLHTDRPHAFMKSVSNFKLFTICIAEKLITLVSILYFGIDTINTQINNSTPTVKREALDETKIRERQAWKRDEH